MDFIISRFLFQGLSINYKKLSPNLENFETLESLFMIFEEFIQTGKAFFFPIEHGQAFLNICM
jgi:hypothetical protein